MEVLPPPPKEPPHLKKLAKIVFEGATAAAGHQLVFDGAIERGVLTPPNSPPKQLLTKKFLEGATAVSGRQGVLERGINGVSSAQTPPS